MKQNNPMSSENNFFEDLRMAKKRNHKIMITNEAIRKVPRVRYQDIPESEYDNIQELAKTVLTISKESNNSNEVALTYSLDNVRLIEKKEKYIGVALGSEHEVDPLSNTTAYHLIHASYDCVVIVLHNHPSLSKFSLPDIKLLLKYNTIKMMVVITNLGNISYLVKKEKYDFNKAVDLYNESVDKNNHAHRLKDLQDAAEYFMKNCHSVGIAYDDK